MKSLSSFFTKFFVFTLLIKIAFAFVAFVYEQSNTRADYEGLLTFLVNPIWLFGFTLPLIAMLAYCVVGYQKAKDGPNRMLKAFGDSCYYLGFLFTIASIILALSGISNNEFNLGVIALRFAAAMVTTLIGMAIRICLITFSLPAFKFKRFGDSLYLVSQEEGRGASSDRREESKVRGQGCGLGVNNSNLNLGLAAGATTPAGACYPRGGDFGEYGEKETGGNKVGGTMEEDSRTSAIPALTDSSSQTDTRLLSGEQTFSGQRKGFYDNPNDYLPESTEDLGYEIRISIENLAALNKCLEETIFNFNKVRDEILNLHGQFASHLDLETTKTKEFYEALRKKATEEASAALIKISEKGSAALTQLTSDFLSQMNAGIQEQNKVLGVSTKEIAENVSSSLKETLENFKKSSEGLGENFKQSLTHVNESLGEINTETLQLVPKICKSLSSFKTSVDDSEAGLEGFTQHLQELGGAVTNISSLNKELVEKIGAEVEHLDKAVEQIQDSVTRVDSFKDSIEKRIGESEVSLANHVTSLEGKISSSFSSLNTKVGTEVDNLNIKVKNDLEGIESVITPAIESYGDRLKQDLNRTGEEILETARKGSAAMHPILQNIDQTLKQSLESAEEVRNSVKELNQRRGFFSFLRREE